LPLTEEHIVFFLKNQFDVLVYSLKHLVDEKLLLFFLLRFFIKLSPNLLASGLESLRGGAIS